MLDRLRAWKATKLATEDNYAGAVDYLRKIKDREYAAQVCSDICLGIGLTFVLARGDDIRVLEDRDLYDRSKRGEVPEIPPYAVLFKGPDDEMDGVDDIIDQIPDDNPLKQYYREINADEKMTG